MSEDENNTDQSSRNWKSWRIPNRIYGRIRTSTVFFGICFVLTSLLYIQVDQGIRADNPQSTEGPSAVDTGQYTGDQSPPVTTGQSPTETPSTTVDPSVTGNPSGPEGSSGEPGSSTSGTGASTTPDPTYLPGMTVPPALRSLIPPAPQAPSATGTP